MISPIEDAQDVMRSCICMQFIKIYSRFVLRFVFSSYGIINPYMYLQVSLMQVWTQSFPLMFLCLAKNHAKLFIGTQYSS